MTNDIVNFTLIINIQDDYTLFIMPVVELDKRINIKNQFKGAL